MGRWKVDKTEAEVTDHIDFANLDHCGSELCVQPPKKESKEHKSDTPKENYDDKDDHYYWPFLL